MKFDHSNLQFIIEGSNLGTWEWNVQTGETVFNARWAEIIGYSLEELSPVSIETWKNFTHPEDLEKSGAELQRHFAGETEFYEMELRMRHKDSRWIWILDRGKIFTRTDNGEPEWIYGSHQDITRQKEAERNLKRILEEKELLMREMNHRIKNNLLLVSSLISLESMQSNRNADLDNLKSRIDAIGLIHETLLEDKDLKTVNIRIYIENLLKNIFEHVVQYAVTVNNEIQEIEVSTEKAVPIGLIVNEIATNAVKHGHQEGDHAVFSIKMDRPDTTGMVELQISDNGDPVPDDLDFDHPRSTGMQLIKSLVMQLDGTIELFRAPHAEYRICLAV